MAKRKQSNQFSFVSSLHLFALAYFTTYILGTILIRVGLACNNQNMNMWGSMMIHLFSPIIAVLISSQFSIGIIGTISVVLATSIASSNTNIASAFIVYLCVVIVTWIMHFVEDIIPFKLFLCPIIALIIGTMIHIISPYIGWVITYIISFINGLNGLNVVLMGMLIALFVGMLSITPFTIMTISSLFVLNGLGLGAALSGVMSFSIGIGLMTLQSGDIGDGIAVLFGTPLLQFSNILSNPITLIPPIVSSLVSGAMSTTIFKIHSTLDAVSLGNCGWFGLIDTVNTMGLQYWIVVVICDILVPIIVNYTMLSILKKSGKLRKIDFYIEK